MAMKTARDPAVPGSGHTRAYPWRMRPLRPGPGAAAAFVDPQPQPDVYDRQVDTHAIRRGGRARGRARDHSASRMPTARRVGAPALPRRGGPAGWGGGGAGVGAGRVCAADPSRPALCCPGPAPGRRTRALSATHARQPRSVAVDRLPVGVYPDGTRGGGRARWRPTARCAADGHQGGAPAKEELLLRGPGASVMVGGVPPEYLAAAAGSTRQTKLAPRSRAGWRPSQRCRCVRKPCGASANASSRRLPRSGRGRGSAICSTWRSAAIDWLSQMATVERSASACARSAAGAATCLALGVSACAPVSRRCRSRPRRLRGAARSPLLLSRGRKPRRGCRTAR